MASTTKSIITIGSEGIIIDAECHVSKGLPKMIIVGLGGKAVEESKERIRAAFANSQLALPRRRIAVNLAPADIPKESTSLDLGIAAAIMIAGKLVKRSFDEHDLLIGELGLDGTVRPVRGIIGKILAAQKLGCQTFYISSGNLSQAILIPGVTLVPVATIRDLYLYLNEEIVLDRHNGGSASTTKLLEQRDSGFGGIIGQLRAKRALIIAAAGGHNMLLCGPPGTGKSMLAKTLTNLLPPLSQDEILEVTHLHSLSTNRFDELVTDRPFRSPHHSASTIAIMGGGTMARPGEVTLSHKGVLLLDEIPEFSRETIESLRQPLEDKYVSIARIKQSVRYPADFILVATANPCPCGYYASNKECQCSASEIIRYQRKISGPILDRIDLHVEVDAVNHAELLTASPAADHAVEQVTGARKVQAKRIGQQKLNAHLNTDELRIYAKLSPEASALLNMAAARLELSARGYIRIVRVARTIADLDNAADICEAHISEAIQYRGIRSFT